MINPIEKINHFKNINEVMERYQGFLIDLWGVVHDGVHAYPGVVDCLNHMIEHEKKIIFLSNAPRPGQKMLEKLIEFGIQASPDMIFTSGDAVRYQLTHFEDPFFKKYGKRFFHLGAERNTDILSGLKVEVTENLEEANFILLTLFLEENEDSHHLEALFQKALDYRLPMLCANPDKQLGFGLKRRCAGVFAEQYEKRGGQVLYYGKPYPNVYERCFERFKEWGIQDKEQILMIGDTLETDILGANRVGIDSALVLTGNVQRLLHVVDNKEPLAASRKLECWLTNPDLVPTWIIDKLEYHETR